MLSIRKMIVYTPKYHDWKFWWSGRNSGYMYPELKIEVLVDVILLDNRIILCHTVCALKKVPSIAHLSVRDDIYQSCRFILGVSCFSDTPKRDFMFAYPNYQDRLYVLKLEGLVVFCLKLRNVY